MSVTSTYDLNTIGSGGGFGGGFGWGPFLAGALIGGRGGLFGNSNDAGISPLIYSQQSQTNDLTAAINAAGTATQNRLDTLGTNQANLIGQTSAQLQNRIDVLGANVTSGFVNVNEALCNARYENAQQTNTITSAICDAKFALSTQMSEGFNKIAMDGANARIADLERQLAVAQTGGPRVQSGTWVSPNPCSQNDDIRNLIIQMGQQNSAQMNAIASALSNVGK